ncbi:unnamed protein product [Phytomonas sp. EM1]|nr:unnamed protein product [Phytomonas sp. EM1]|eukprot:CCW63418.1 unnamed protein product [Phytomonas sp. isolate EM1]
MPSEDQIRADIDTKHHKEIDTSGQKHDNEFEYSSSFVVDSSVLLSEIRRIENTTRAISRALAAMTTCNENEEILSRTPDLCNDLEDNEKALFSPIPDYVAQIIDAEKQRRLKMSQKTQPHDECRQTKVSVPPRLSGDGRAYVDPSVPLPLPYDARRDYKGPLRKNRARGTYHDLFYGDRSECVFAPPQDNKRIQIEQKKNSKPVPSNAKPPRYEPTPRKTMKVPKDLAPTCAYRKKADPHDEI